MFPTDVFAVAGYLLKLGGVIAFFDPSPYTPPEKMQPCHFSLSIQEREDADIAAENWRDPKQKVKGEPPELVQKLWDTLIAAWDDPVTPGTYLSKNSDRYGTPEWWKAATLLAMIADMACNRLLRDPLPKYDPSPFEQWVAGWYLSEDNPDGSSPSSEDPDADSGIAATSKPPASLCQMVDSAVVCVMPKVRVAPVGAAMRNLSRNLALLPGRGEVRCSWILSPAVDENDKIEDFETLDILLIPEPAELFAHSFIAENDEHISAKDKHYYKRNWENFGIRQDWLLDPDDDEEHHEKTSEFLKRCIGFMKEAKKQSRTVNGVVLPEYALTFKVFEDLCKLLKKVEPNLEFIISGSSDNCEVVNGGEPEPGNHVLTRVWYSAEDHETTSRRKHHRWRMDRNQVETYALSSALNPKIPYWWEDSPLGRREVHFHRFRKKSVFSVLICEELARSEPCHEILRSVAPNLIFALLMDGPQIRERWPAQYASNLADDPGSSVLTFTSFGLIDRANKQGRYTPNRSIALWKDDGGNVVQLNMPEGAKHGAVLLSLWSEHVLDRTITGKNSEARSWRYSSHFPITLAK
ncbi:hypothetical protein [Shimia sp.]